MGASESPPTVRPETHPLLLVPLAAEPLGLCSAPCGAPPGEDEGAHPSPHLMTECGGASCLPPLTLHSGAGSQPSTCPTHEEPCPCHLSLSTPWHCGAHLLLASACMQLGMQRFPVDQDRQSHAAHCNSHPERSSPASCRAPFRRRQRPIMHPLRHPCHPYSQDCSPQRLGLMGSWRHDMEKDMARVGGWAPQESQWRLAWQKPSCICPASGIGCLRVGWGLCPLEDNAMARLLPQLSAGYGCSGPQVCCLVPGGPQ